MTQIQADISLVISLIALAVAIVTTIINIKQWRLEDRERERRRIVEAYRMALYFWLTNSEYWKKHLEHKTIPYNKVSYDAEKRALRKIEFEREFDVLSSHQFEKEIIWSRINEIESKLVNKRKRVIESLKNLYESMEKLAKVIDTDDFREKCERLLDIWRNIDLRSSSSYSLKTLIEHLVSYLISGIAPTSAIERFVKEFASELEEERTRIKQSNEWLEFKEILEEARDNVMELEKLLQNITQKFEKEYRLALEELRPEGSSDSIYRY